MDLAWISVAALVVTVLVSCTTRLNPGILAITFAWLIAAFLSPKANPSVTVKTVLAGFPADLFLTLTGVTLLFAQAQVNGTLAKVARAAVRCCRGNAGLIPLAFFVLAAAISAVGAGSVATAALVAPMAMAAAANARIPAFLMAIMIGHGAVAGGMSPFAMTGIIANGLMDRMGLKGYEWPTFFHNLTANALVAVAGYLIFGGWQLFRQKAAGVSANPKASILESHNESDLSAHETGTVETHGQPPHSIPLPFRGGEGVRKAPEGNRQRAKEPARAESGSSGELERKHRVTLCVIAMWIVAVLAFKVHVGLAAFAAAALLTLAGAADEKETIGAVPWAVILMVCGVTVLTSLLERTGGIDRITDVIARVSTPRSLPGVMAFSTGVISVYSSTSGVVLPAFLPSVPGLVEKLGGGEPLAIASSINIGGNLVDVSPLSTIGALCIACASASEDRRVLFNKVLAWGLSMSVVAALLCTLFFG